MLTFNGTYYGSNCTTKVSSSGTGYGKKYTVVTDVFDSSGNIVKTITNTYPLVDSYIYQKSASIPKNTVHITTPIDSSADLYYKSVDGIMCMCCNCDLLEEFDFTADIDVSTYPQPQPVLKGNINDFAFFNCESLKTVNLGDWFSCTNSASNRSLCCFMGCKNLETITGVFNFGDASVYQSNLTHTGWDDLKLTADSMFYGCDKLTGVQIHLTGNSTSFINDKVYETLGLKLNQFTLV